MKKLLTLLALCLMVGLQGWSQSATAAQRRGTTLKSVYTSLANMPGATNVEQGSMNSLRLIKADVLDNVQALTFNLPDSFGNSEPQALYSILQQIPMSNILIGGTNGRVIGYVYAMPLTADCYEVLVVGIVNDWAGIVYGTADRATVSMIQSLPLKMQGPNLQVPILVNQNNQDYLIDLSSD